MIYLAADSAGTATASGRDRGTAFRLQNLNLVGAIGVSDSSRNGIDENAFNIR